MSNLGKMALNEQKKNFNGQDNLNTANKLLAQNTNDDYEILSQLGLSDHDLDAKLESLGEYTRISEYEEDWGLCVSEKVLKDIAYKNNLTLGESKYYKFSVPITITSDIKKWMKKTGMKTSDSSSFFILAPSESFYSDDDFFTKNEKKIIKTDSDPMLTYEIPGSSMEGGSVYSLITEWGSDLNTMRKINAFFVNNAKTFTIIGIFLTIFLITFLTYLGVNNLTEGLVGNNWITILTSISAFIVGTITLKPLFNEIDPKNINRKRFNILNRNRNFQFPKLIYFDKRNDEIQYSNFFVISMIRFLITGGLATALFSVYMIISDRNILSFSEELGMSGWYFTIPFGIIGLIFSISLVANVFKNFNL